MHYYIERDAFHYVVASSNAKSKFHYNSSINTTENKSKYFIFYYFNTNFHQVETKSIQDKK